MNFQHTIALVVLRISQITQRGVVRVGLWFFGSSYISIGCYLR